ncbi:MAG: DUF2284 domain-containing protein [Desulfobacteraceae bacterium]|nr:DUF2284 domain-containing protein [Desulfobacteraceae bacterium]
MSSVTGIAQHYFTDMKEISSEEIVFRSEVRKLCEMNTCGNYGKNWTCPPAVEPIDAFRDRFGLFDTLLVVYRVYHVKSSFDWNGMKAGMSDFKDRLLDVKKEMEAADPHFDFIVLGAGACHLCDPCAYVDEEPCRNPEDAIVSLEACGIDVMRLMKDHGMKYYNGKNTVTYVGGILYNKSQNN